MLPLDLVKGSCDLVSLVISIFGQVCIDWLHDLAEVDGSSTCELVEMINEALEFLSWVTRRLNLVAEVLNPSI